MFSATSDLRFYWRLAIKPHRWQALVVSLLMLASAAFETMTIALAIPLLDVVSSPERAVQGRVVGLVTGGLGRAGFSTTLNMVIFALLLLASSLFVIRAAVILLHQYAVAGIGHKIRREMRSSLFEKFLHAHYGDLVNRGRGAILNDINTPSDAVYNAIMNLASMVAAVLNGLLLIGFMMYLSWWVTVVVGMLAIGGIQVGRSMLKRRAEECGRVLYALRGDLSRAEVDSIDGVKVVKTHVLEPLMLAHQRRLLDAERQPLLKLALYRHAPMFVTEVMAILLVLALGAVAVMIPALGMQFSSLVAFLLAARRASPSIATVGALSVDINKSKRALEVVEEVLELMRPENQGDRRVLSVNTVCLADVSFRYGARSDDGLTLKDIHLKMNRGAVTAIVGATGSGKSTIAHLIVGLYQPCSGSIFVDDADLRELNLADWRRRVGYVPQDVFLFNTSIRNNIALWDENVSDEKVEWAARVAQLHDFVMTLPEKYEALVGDRGLMLSGGQSQRVAIARAILRQPEVLIFDEATSALDNLTERAVYESISLLRKDAIVIVIAHRLSTVRSADQIAVLRSGTVTEIGTHEELMGRRGVYAELYETDVGKPSGPSIVGLRWGTPS